MDAPKRLTGRPWRRLKARVLAGSTVCHICGHDDADTADHVIPIARGGNNHPSNLKPAHHAPCPTCERMCNREKNGKEFAPIIRDSGSIRRPRGSAPSPPHSGLFPA